MQKNTKSTIENTNASNASTAHTDTNIKTQNYQTCLSIAGSDPSGGAGIQADLKTFQAIGCYGMSVITALTAQNTTNVSSVFPVPLAMLADQMDMIFEDIHVDCVKTGMLFSAQHIQCISKKLDKIRKSTKINIVVDPVMISKSGKHLLNPDAIDALVTQLLPIATIITPNLHETQALLDHILSSPTKSTPKNTPDNTSLSSTSIETASDMLFAAQELVKLGPRAVLIKGGHLNGADCNDLLLIKSNDGPDEVLWFESKRVLTTNTHGTGCTFSSAICAYLAKGCSLSTAVANGKNYISKAIESGKNYKLGHGYGPVKHFSGEASYGITAQR